MSQEKADEWEAKLSIPLPGDDDDFNTGATVITEESVII
jgi:hypothetical protein